ncbi:MAG: (2Fe-2S)-binding protein [Chloroflexi bacterium]|nr:(2Fe-2S)-binding protein [Chloroflexota bacterium]
MLSTRIPTKRGLRLTVTIDGKPVVAYAGETVAAVLLASGQIVFQQNEIAHVPRSLFCGMGVCFNCLVTVDGVPNIRACVTPVAAGMVIETRGGSS